jgi:hypothetical protein
MRIPKALPNSILHTAPEWYIDEYGELTIGSSDGFSENPKASVQRGLRHPFTTRDPNAVSLAVQQEKAEKRSREIRAAVNERLRATLSIASSVQPSNFEIYDETKAKPTPPETPSSSSAIDDIISRAAGLSIAGRKQDPEGLSPGSCPLDDAEILTIMLDTLSTALDVAEARKYTYAHSPVVKPCARGGPLMWVTRYVDYTSKYGLGFLLNDGR